MEENRSPLVALSEGLADVVEKVGPSVVRVRGARRRPASGLIFAEGLVLTAAHAVEREEDLSVETHGGERFAASFAGRDERNDLAVLRVEGLSAGAATPAARQTRVGELALTLGRPSRTEGAKVSLGVVSAVGSVRGGWGRRRGGRGRGTLPERYVQADAAPYPGLGGGALLGASGEVLGVVTAGMRGATLAAPADLAWSVAKDLAEKGSVKRGYLGVYSQPVRLPAGHGLARQGGLLVVGVGEDTPASRAGIIVGDILATLDDQSVEDTEDLLTLLGPEKVGQNVQVRMLRGGELTELEVLVGERD